MLYVVPGKQLLGSNITAEALTAFEALAVISKGDYANKLPDIFHSRPRRLEALVKSGVVNWPFNPKKSNL